MSIKGLDEWIEERDRKRPCCDCEGRGFNYSDPDGRQLICSTCDGYGSEAERMAEAERKADEERDEN